MMEKQKIEEQLKKLLHPYMEKYRLFHSESGSFESDIWIEILNELTGLFQSATEELREENINTLEHIQGALSRVGREVEGETDGLSNTKFLLSEAIRVDKIQLNYAKKLLSDGEREGGVNG